jgi:hypothetical protein
MSDQRLGPQGCVDRSNENLGQGNGLPSYRSDVENGPATPLLALSLQAAKQGNYLLVHGHQPDSTQITHRYLIIPQFRSICQWATSTVIAGIDLTKL